MSAHRITFGEICKIAKDLGDLTSEQLGDKLNVTVDAVDSYLYKGKTPRSTPDDIYDRLFKEYETNEELSLSRFKDKLITYDCFPDSKYSFVVYSEAPFVKGNYRKFVFGCIELALDIRKASKHISKNELTELAVFREKERIYKDLGIIDFITELKTKDGRFDYTPSKCIASEVTKSLSFVGIGGLKWLYPYLDIDRINSADIQMMQEMGESDRTADFEGMLRRVEDSTSGDGKVQFLLVNTYRIATSKGARDASELASLETLEKWARADWQRLVKDHANLEVRIYDAYPAFRLQFINGGIVIVSEYHHVDVGASKPFMVVEKKFDVSGRNASLYEPFDKVFLDLWRSGGEKSNKKKAHMTLTLAKWIERNFPDEKIR